jgi:hypothetical protein
VWPNGMPPTVVPHQFFIALGKQQITQCS